MIGYTGDEDEDPPQAWSKEISSFEFVINNMVQVPLN